MKSIHKNIIKFLISGIILIYVFFNIDFKEFFLLLKNIEYFYLIPAFLLLFVSLFLMVLKWIIILKKYIVIKLKRIFLIYWSSDFINIFGLGAIGGETYKMIAFENKKKALMTSLFDKILSFYWYLALGSSFLLSYVILKNTNITFVIFLGFCIYVLINLITLVLNYYRKKVIKKIPIKKIRNILNKINLTSKNLIYHSLLSVLIIVNTALIYSLIFKSLSLKMMIVQLMIFIPILKIAVTLPISFEGLGVREFLFIKFASIVSINLELALLSSLIIYFLSMFYRFTGIIPFLFFNKKKNNINNSIDKSEY